MSLSVGGSVANARAPSVSIIRLTQRSYSTKKMINLRFVMLYRCFVLCKKNNIKLPQQHLKVHHQKRAAMTLITKAATLTVS
jgi:SAM35, subunit of SAM coomplex